MQSIELTPEEREVISDVLNHEIEAINIEVFRTDTHDFKEKLKRRRTILEHLLQKVTVIPVGA